MQIEHSRFVVSGTATPDLLSSVLETLQGCRLKSKPDADELAKTTKVTVRCVDKKPIVEAVMNGETKTFNVSKRDYQKLWDWHNAKQAE